MPHFYSLKNPKMPSSSKTRELFNITAVMFAALLSLDPATDEAYRQEEDRKEPVVTKSDTSFSVRGLHKKGFRQ